MIIKKGAAVVLLMLISASTLADSVEVNPDSHGPSGASDRYGELTIKDLKNQVSILQGEVKRYQDVFNNLTQDLK